MRIKIGDKLPNSELFYLDQNNDVKKIDILDLCKGKTIILGMPGAFTKTCSALHLPGYIKNYNLANQKGITKIVCIAVNDPNVMKAWGENQNAGSKIFMAGDLVYNGVHHYVGQRDDAGSLCVSNWIEFLLSLEASSFDHVYAGHGPNAGFELIGSSIDYLKCVRDIVTDPQKTREDYRNFVNTRFPEHQVPEMVDISDFFVYGPPDSNS